MCIWSFRDVCVNAQFHFIGASLVLAGVLLISARMFPDFQSILPFITNQEMSKDVQQAKINAFLLVSRINRLDVTEPLFNHPSF